MTDADLKQVTRDMRLIIEANALEDLFFSLSEIGTHGRISDRDALLYMDDGEQALMWDLEKQLRQCLRLPSEQAERLAKAEMLPTATKLRIAVIADLANHLRTEQQKPQTRAAAVASKVNQQLRTKRSGGIITIATSPTDPLIRRGAQCR